MQILTISHIRPQNASDAVRVRVSYQPSETARPITHECDFTFSITDVQRGDIQWYLETYLEDPWGPFKDRAKRRPVAVNV